jgi:hypothetical protein
MEMKTVEDYADEMEEVELNEDQAIKDFCSQILMAPDTRISKRTMLGLEPKRRRSAKTETMFEPKLF